MTFKEALAEYNGLWLLEKATGLSATELRLASGSTVLEAEAEQLFLQMTEQIRKHIPLQYILGSWDFMGLTIKCRPGVLIPRRDTEILAEEAIQFLKNSPGNFSILDLCTGSGCIGIALAKYCTHVTASDISSCALELARENAEINGVGDRITFVESNLFENIEGRFNCITANPPYIPTAELAALPEEVKKEPELALDGGPDGLDFYRAIVPACSQYLLPGGVIFFEIGNTQGKAVAEILRKHGFKAILTVKDLEGRDRVVQGTNTRSSQCLTD